MLGRPHDLGLDRRDRLADVPRLELRKLLAVRDDRVRERVEQAGALGAGRLPPRPLERLACGGDRTVDVRLAGHRGPCEQLAGRRLVQLPNSPEAGSTLSPPMWRPCSCVAVAIDWNLASGREQVADPHVLGQQGRKRAGSSPTYARQRSRPAL